MNSIVDIRDSLSSQYVQIKRNELYIAKALADIGDYKMSARSNDFNGWMLCDGRELDCNDYDGLFEVIGNAFGGISASNTFKLPDFRGRVIGQAGTGAGLTARALGDTVGTETHALAVNEMPSHTHVGNTLSAGDHTHTATTASAGTHTHGITDPGHTHTQTTINDDFNSSGANPPGFAADSAGTRTWNNINSATTGISVENDGDHTHDVTVVSAGSHSHTFVTSAVGSGHAHNIMQPTLFGVHVFIYSGRWCEHNLT